MDLIPLLSATKAAADLCGSTFEKLNKFREAELDKGALKRLLLLEARRNLAILDVAVDRAIPLPNEALWEVPELLQSEVLEVLLGRGEDASKALSAVAKLKVRRKLDTQDSVSFLMNLYVRVTALRSIALLHRRKPLANVRIKRRLVGLHDEYVRLVKTLVENA